MKPKANHDQRPAVVVVGLDCITGLQTARVFARRGVQVVGVASDPKHFCCRTRACSRVISADINGPELIERLMETGPSFARKPVLVPCTDNSVLQISKDRGALSAFYRMALPVAGTIERLIDKVQFSHFAEENGLPTPRSATLTSLEEAGQAATQINFPAVLKPDLKTVRWVHQTKEKAVVVNSAEELIRAVKQCLCWCDALLLQEWIPGPIENHYTCDAYFDAQSQPLVTYTSQKLRQWPPMTGVGSISADCDNPAVRQQAIRLFQAAGYHGLAYVEMKRHELTGEYLIVEPNVGRPTGRSACAEATGVEMLYTMYCDLAGLPLPAARQQKFTGKTWIYWKRDLHAAWWGMRAGDLTFSGWVRSIRGCKTCAVFCWRDPVPFFADWLRIGKQIKTAAGKRGAMSGS
ncbi:MAG: carboxylate--amine ligase [Verrucomicrobia bacterium]|nr:carboxylate--amine ligase [Verrucomicrobiota bacterium]